MITVLTFLPLLAALGAFLLPGRDERHARIWALGGALLSLAVMLRIASGFQATV